MVRINEQLRIELEKTQAELENSKNIKLQKQMKVMRKFSKIIIIRVGYPARKTLETINFQWNKWKEV